MHGFLRFFCKNGTAEIRMYNDARSVDDSPEICLFLPSYGKDQAVPDGFGAQSRGVRHLSGSDVFSQSVQNCTAAFEKHTVRRLRKTFFQPVQTYVH